MLEKNTSLIIGNIDSGKTKGIIFPKMQQYIENNENLFILDSKEEYYTRYKIELEKHGYHTYVINLLEPFASNGWNPLQYPYYLYKHHKIDQCLEIVNRIVNNICRGDNKNVDPFWELTAADYLASLIITLFKKGKEEEIHFGSLGILLNKGESGENATLIKNYFDQLDPLDPAYVLASPTVFSPNETRASILSVLRQKMNVLFTKPETLKMLCINDLVLQHLENKIAIFVIAKKNMNFITNIFLEELIGSIKDQRLSFTFVLDNFHTLPKFDKIDDLIENATYNQIKTVFAIHNTQEIIDKYDSDIFAKVTNVINVEENPSFKLDEVNSPVAYPKLPEKQLQFVDIKQIFN